MSVHTHRYKTIRITRIHPHAVVRAFRVPTALVRVNIVLPCEHEPRGWTRHRKDSLTCHSGNLDEPNWEISVNAVTTQGWLPGGEMPSRPDPPHRRPDDHGRIRPERGTRRQRHGSRTPISPTNRKP